MPNIRNLITASEAAEIIGVDVSYIARLVRDGKLPAKKAFEGLRAPYLIERRAAERFKASRDDAKAAS